MSVRLLAVSLVSAGVLAYEILLARLFSIIQWYHFAYMVISIALLGYGASGTFLALVRDRLQARASAAFAICAALFGITAVACFALAQRLPFNALELIWDPRQLLYLGALYAILFVPFFCGATCVGLALACFAEPVGRIYRADLLGAGGGALGILALLFLVVPSRALELIGALGLLAAALASLAETGRRARLRALGCAAGAAAHGIRAAARLDRPAALALQGPEPGAARARRRGRARALQPARSAQRGAQSANPVPPRAGAQPEQPARAGGADRRVHRRRGAEPDHRVRRRPPAVRLSGFHHRGAALPPARPAARPGARRGRRRRRAARAVPPGAFRSMRSS